VLRGLTENAGPEIGGPKNNNRLKISGMKINAGPNCRTHENVRQNCLVRIQSNHLQSIAYKVTP